MRITDKYVLFYGKTDILSNFWTFPNIDVEVAGKIVSISSSEQLFMYCKAIYFEDFPMADRILKAQTPGETKKMGRRIRNYNESDWNDVREKIMKSCLKMKLLGCPGFKEELSKEIYKDKKFVEASPSDKIWGVGLSENDPIIYDEAEWKGLNLLGNLLSELRDDIAGN